MNIPLHQRRYGRCRRRQPGFPRGMDNGEDVVIDLGGHARPGRCAQPRRWRQPDRLRHTFCQPGQRRYGQPGRFAGHHHRQWRLHPEADGILEIEELGGTTPGTGHDQLVLTGAATCRDARRHPDARFHPQSGDTFFIVNHLTRRHGQLQP